MVGAGLGAEGLNFGVSPTIHERLALTFDVFAKIVLNTQDAVRELTSQQQPAS